MSLILFIRLTLKMCWPILYWLVTSFAKFIIEDEQLAHSTVKNQVQITLSSENTQCHLIFTSNWIIWHCQSVMTWYSKLLILNGPLATSSLAVAINQKLLTSNKIVSLKTEELAVPWAICLLYHKGIQTS